MKLRPFGFAAAAAVTLAGLPALANGRFPAAGLVATDPSDPAHLIVRTTYGLTITHDNGAHWGWVCEAAIGYGGTEDPMVAITKDGSIIAGIFEGLSASHDQGCQWDFAQGASATATSSTFPPSVPIPRTLSCSSPTASAGACS